MGLLLPARFGCFSANCQTMAIHVGVASAATLPVSGMPMQGSRSFADGIGFRHSPCHAMGTPNNENIAGRQTRDLVASTLSYTQPFGSTNAAQLDVESE